MRNKLIGGKADSNSEAFNQFHFELGKLVEMEHTDDEDIATEIAADHLIENPNYYIELIKSGLVDEPLALSYYKTNKQNL